MKDTCRVKGVLERRTWACDSNRTWVIGSIPRLERKDKVKEAISQATKELSIEEVRKILGIRPEDLTEELEIENIEKLREKEKDRLKGEKKSGRT